MTIYTDIQNINTITINKDKGKISLETLKKTQKLFDNVQFFLRTKDYKNAIFCLKRILTINPSNTKVLAVLVVIYAEICDDQGIINCLTKVKEY